MQLSDLRISVSRHRSGEQRCRSQSWGFKSLSDTRLRTCCEAMRLSEPAEAGEPVRGTTGAFWIGLDPFIQNGRLLRLHRTPDASAGRQSHSLGVRGRRPPSLGEGPFALIPCAQIDELHGHSRHVSHVKRLRQPDRPLDREHVSVPAAREDRRRPRAAPDRGPHP